MRKLKMDELNRLSLEDFHQADKHPLVVVLDNVRSMFNVGVIFRTCDAFRVEKLYLCGITPHPPHRDIHKTALGAEESVAWEGHEQVGEVLSGLKTHGYHILSIEQTDQSVLLNEFVPEKEVKYAIVLGHEVEGVSEEAISFSDVALEIPQFGTKHSLNVSVAAGIVMYALTRG